MTDDDLRPMTPAAVAELIKEAVAVAEWGLGRSGCPFCGAWATHDADCIAKAFGARDYDGNLHPEDQPPRKGQTAL